ncbi:MAG: N-acetylmuramoyl-L-alanine amidase [Patescibacteria group bacterium]
MNWLKDLKILGVAALVIITFFFVWLLPDEHGDYPLALRQLVGQVFPERLTPDDAATKYAKGELRVLVVPGHDNTYSGAEFRGLRESDLTRTMAERIVFYLKQNRNLSATTTRDFSTGEYSPEFASYFEREREAIRSFRSTLRRQFVSLLQSGQVKEEVVVPHNFAPDEASIRLYGINKWANEHLIDLALHIHFNDHAGRRGGQVGKYRGFSIYVPEDQLPGHRLSHGLAESIKEKLALESPVSDLPKESSGVIQDQELIAIGANGSRDGASILVEYGYIYETRFVDPARRAFVLDLLARRTAEGLAAYFAGNLAAR